MSICFFTFHGNLSCRLNPANKNTCRKIIYRSVNLTVGFMLTSTDYPNIMHRVMPKLIFCFTFLFLNRTMLVQDLLIRRDLATSIHDCVYLKVNRIKILTFLLRCSTQNKCSIVIIEIRTNLGIFFWCVFLFYARLILSFIQTVPSVFKVMFFSSEFSCALFVTVETHSLHNQIF